MTDPAPRLNEEMRTMHQGIREMDATREVHEMAERHRREIAAIRSCADAAEGAYTRGLRELYRSDGSPRYSDAERERSLKSERDGAIEGLTRRVGNLREEITPHAEGAKHSGRYLSDSEMTSAAPVSRSLERTSRASRSMRPSLWRPLPHRAGAAHRSGSPHATPQSGYVLRTSGRGREGECQRTFPRKCAACPNSPES